MTGPYANSSFLCDPSFQNCPVQRGSFLILGER